MAGRLSVLAVAVVLAVLGVASVQPHWQATALFPPTTSEAALDRPVQSTSVCGSPPTSFCTEESGTCFPCNATCPYGASADGSRCACPDAFPVQQNEATCCETRAGQNCVDRLSQDAHPPFLAVDGASQTYFQSSLNMPTVNFTLDLLIPYEVTFVTINFGDRVPYAFGIFKSNDNVSWQPFKFFARECEQFFGMMSDEELTEPDQVICETTSTSVRNEEISFRTLTTRRIQLAGGSYAESDVLQRFVRARYVRLAMVQYYTEETAVDDFGVSLDHEPFYRIHDMQVEGRCGCNGHSGVCRINKDGANCDCQHNTQGQTCAACLPLFNAKPWARGVTLDEPNPCVACECNDHADSCHYNATVDAFPEDRTRGNGGVCDNCQHNTAGINCETCVPNFFENPDVSRNHVNACLPCACHEAGSSTATCDVATGECTCKDNVQGRLCGVCTPGFYNLSAINDDGCQSCGCVTYGTVDGSRQCHAETGQCNCLASNTGRRCQECSLGYFQLAGSEEGVCLSCHPQCSDEQGCSAPGTSLAACNGQCRNFEEDGLCVHACSQGRYADDNGVCRVCHSQCLDTCTAAGPTVEACDGQCRNFEEDGACVAECSVDSHPDDDRVCQQCHSECIGCTGPDATQCKLCRNVRDAGECVASCPEGKYADGSGECQPCSGQCVLSAGCTGPSPSQCRQCQGVYDVSLPTVDFTCLSECQSLHFISREPITVSAGDTTTTTITIEDARVCRPCSSQCALACDGPTARDCVGGCVAVSYDGTCVPTCPTHTYRDGGICSRCHPNCNHTRGCFGPGRHQCVECRDNAVVLGQECYPACPSDHFADDDGICQPCHQACSTCFGPTARECFRCESYRVSTACVDSCPSATTYPSVIPGAHTTTTAQPITDFESSGDTTELTTRAPRSNTTVPASAFECLPCHPQCGISGCTGPTASDCNQCLNVQLEGECIEECPVGTYRDGTVCKPCHPQCAGGCFASGADSCVACRGLEVAGVCLEECPETYVLVNDTCLPCHRFCSLDKPGCSGIGPDACNACAPTRFRVAATGTCVAACPINTFSTDNRTCLACNDECGNGCFGPEPSQCSQCANVKLADTCVAECPGGFYVDGGGVCQRCDPLCASLCSGPGPARCVPHPDNGTVCALLQRGATCVAACDSATEYTEDGLCLTCSEHCAAEGCTGPTASDCVACRSAVLDGTCVDVCPPTHYRDEAGVCRRCHAECAPANDTRYCTGPGPDACLACAHVKRGRECVRSCMTTEVAVGDLCRSCHPECSDRDGCFGLEATQCIHCRNFEFDGACVAACDEDSTFTSTTTSECLPCHEKCSLRAGSGGCPTGTGAEDCAVCLHVRDNGRCETECSTGFYADATDTATATATALGGVCKPCHPTCDPLRGCTGARADQCNSCAQVSYKGQCRSGCPERTFISSGNECVDCDANCLLGCTGPGADQCQRSSNVLESSAEALGCRAHVHIAANGVITCVPACPTGTYSDSEGVCRRCSTLCPIEYGCTGPSLDECNECPATQYLQADRTCADCSAACSQTLGATGCRGPEPEQCFACAGARYSGGCVGGCSVLTDVDKGLYFVTDTSNSDEDKCVPCHEQCAPGGCTGPGPHECLFGCKNFANVDAGTQEVTCVASCGANTYVLDTPQPRTCTACNAKCRGGCTDATTSTCVECARFETEEGECVDVCPSGWVPDTDGVCRCPSDRSYTDAATGQCLPCSVLCAAGCTGPLPSQCKGGSDGCTVAEHNGECVAACPRGMVRQDSLCVCNPNHILQADAADGCVSCHEQCSDGCTGPTARDCVRCRNYRAGTTCVAECPTNEQPNTDRVCAPCHPECAGGCRAPGDPLQCDACRVFEDQGRCVGSCPAERFFLTQSRECVEACPSDTPFYNDTRTTGGDEAQGPQAPQLCVQTCASLGANRNTINTDFPFRCSSQEQVGADLASSSGEDNSLSQTSLIIIVVAGAVLLIAAVAVFAVLRRNSRNTNAAINPSGTNSTPPRTKLNGAYESSPRRHGRGGASVYSDVSFDSGAHYDVANRSGDNSVYLEALPQDEPEHLGGYLEVQPQNPYSMSDQALFESPAATPVQSTRM